MDIKKAIYATVIAGAGAVTTVYLTDEERRERLKAKSKEMYHKVCALTNKKKGKTSIKRMGNPDPYDIEDQRMVEEGALYSVQKYNEIKQ
ncbi:hypothetical protein [Alkalihalobacillus trypoxylicola]|uniref:YtxH domain-containing protein n=1 Tax=Alkalihalobacillus trypoxylicola TaxID=519424 RepID=A0A162EE01_9BACI|nr:hypothetical protein [Alkalihalobacillus trypoxylicola]KYG32356.1 hypothetical protein AZF04_06230 [Alkalihalobacillus trypoxylicola]